MNKYIIRNIKESDMYKIQKLIESCGPYVAAYNIYVYWMLGAYNPSTCFAAEENNKIIGAITAIQSIERNTAFIWQICVDKDHRSKNIAYNLIDTLINSCRNMKIRTIELGITESNEASLNLFAKYAKSKNLEFNHVKNEVIGENTDKVFQIIIS